MVGLWITKTNFCQIGENCNLIVVVEGKRRQNYFEDLFRRALVEVEIEFEIGIIDHTHIP